MATDDVGITLGDAPVGFGQPTSSKNGANGFLSYLPVNSNQVLSQPLWVTKIGQDNQLQGVTHQSPTTRHFYPRSYAPGVISITAQAASQVEYQTIAVFIRAHQEMMITGGIVQIYTSASQVSGYQHLLQLIIPEEGMYLQGWINQFALIKKGVFDPAPIFQFGYNIARDYHSTNVEISHALRQWFTASNTDITTTTTNETSTPNPNPATGALGQ